MTDERFDGLLRLSLQKAARADLSSAMEQEEDVTFNSAYLKQKEKMLSEPFRYAKKTVESKGKKLVKRVASVLLALLAIGGIWLSVDSEARAAVESWIITVSEEFGFVYRFAGSADAEELPEYSLSWIPEGYQPIDLSQSRHSYSALYQRRDDIMSGFGFGYFLNDLNGTWYISLQPETDAYIVETIEINGKPADLYLCTDGSETSNLIWLSEDETVVFELNGFLTREELIRIAEGVTLN